MKKNYEKPDSLAIELEKQPFLTESPGQGGEIGGAGGPEHPVD